MSTVKKAAIAAMFALPVATVPVLFAAWAPAPTAVVHPHDGGGQVAGGGSQPTPAPSSSPDDTHWG
jgi:hypothetical protein